MKRIIDFITEKLTIGSSSKIFKSNIEQEYNDKKKLQVTNKELQEIEEYAEDLPIPPVKIKTGMQGNIKLIWDKEFTEMGITRKYSCNISKPDRYKGSFKITLEIGRYRPYEYPIGKEGYKDPKGNLRLPDIKSIFDHLNKIWDKYNLSEKLK